MFFTDFFAVSWVIGILGIFLLISFLGGIIFLVTSSLVRNLGKIPAPFYHSVQINKISITENFHSKNSFIEYKTKPYGQNKTMALEENSISFETETDRISISYPEILEIYVGRVRFFGNLFAGMLFSFSAFVFIIIALPSLDKPAMLNILIYFEIIIVFIAIGFYWSYFSRKLWAVAVKPSGHEFYGLCFSESKNWTVADLSTFEISLRAKVFNP